MKLSLAWIFDHINADWKLQDVDALVKKFNAVTAEIEKVYTVSYTMQQFFMAIFIGQEGDAFILDIPELGKRISLSCRGGAQELFEAKPGLCYLIKQDNGQFDWASVIDFGVEKGSLLPPFDVSSEKLTGAWRLDFESEDIIIEVDNKSITHRPDMWGHRGFAREIASFLNLELKDESKFLVPLATLQYDEKSDKTDNFPFVIHNQTSERCSKFVGLYLSSVEHKPSNLFIASRLLKIGAKPYGGLVDITNYLMNDWSQPVHAYDADTIEDRHIIIRQARAQEALDLLDGSSVTLTPEDIVIADSKRPMCLAGVKGGKEASVGLATNKIFLEAAHFEAASVRRTAQRHKLRTDSSARYEKTLDPEQTLQAPQRFIALLQQCGIQSTYEPTVVVVGKTAQDLIIDVEHNFLEKQCGIALENDDIVKPLTRLGFHVVVNRNEQDGTVYRITVPSFRASKDIKIKEDILEEVIRSYGFERITHVLPRFAQHPFDLSITMRTRIIKRFFAYTGSMIEQQNYAFHDESFIAQFGHDPKASVSLVNPISENHYRMIDSLIPGLLKNIKENHQGHDNLAFFECGKRWERVHDKVNEYKSVAGIIFDKRNTVDFYTGKQLLVGLLNLLGLPLEAIEWKKAAALPIWYNKQQTTEIFYNDRCIGYAGKVNQLILSQLDILQGIDAFIFELDLDFLLTVIQPAKRMKKISKFQETSFDISIVIPLTLTVAHLKKVFSDVHPLIYSVELIDFFEKEEWDNQRSVAFRFWMQHPERTLEKDDIDAAWKNAVSIAENNGATLRT